MTYSCYCRGPCDMEYKLDRVCLLLVLLIPYTTKLNCESFITARLNYKNMKLSHAWCLYVEACEVFKAYKVKLVFVNTQDYIALCSMDHIKTQSYISRTQSGLCRRQQMNDALFFFLQCIYNVNTHHKQYFVVLYLAFT